MSEPLREILQSFGRSQEAIASGESEFAQRVAWRKADLDKAVADIQALIDAAREEGRKEGRASAFGCHLCSAPQGEEHQDWCQNKEAAK